MHDVHRALQAGILLRCVSSTGRAPGSYYKPADEILKAACMSKWEAEKYLKGRDGLAWHISDLKIYDNPRKLEEFTGLQRTQFGMRPIEVQRPPQSWRYVEELE